jgi:hypothetical protein
VSPCAGTPAAAPAGGEGFFGEGVILAGGGWGEAGVGVAGEEAVGGGVMGGEGEGEVEGVGEVRFLGVVGAQGAVGGVVEEASGSGLGKSARERRV